MCAMKCICSAGVLGGPLMDSTVAKSSVLAVNKGWDWALGSEPTLQLNACALGLRAYLLKRAHRGWFPNYSELR